MFPDEAETLEITVGELSTLLEAGPEAPAFTLADCREEDEFAICKIGEAALVPLSGFPENTTALTTDPDCPVVVYCHHGMRSAHAASFLRDHGVAKAYSLRGGIDAWSQEIDPSVVRY